MEYRLCPPLVLNEGAILPSRIHAHARSVEIETPKIKEALPIERYIKPLLTRDYRHPASA